MVALYSQRYGLMRFVCNKEVNYVRLGCNFSNNRSNRSSVWIWRNRRGISGNCQVSVLSLPSNVRDLLYLRPEGKRSSLIQAAQTVCCGNKEGRSQMRLNCTVREAGATGYILLRLSGIPIPILLLIFLLRGCT
jgi:hypothetical protein